MLVRSSLLVIKSSNLSMGLTLKGISHYLLFGADLSALGAVPLWCSPEQNFPRRRRRRRQDLLCVASDLATRKVSPSKVALGLPLPIPSSRTASSKYFQIIQIIIIQSFISTTTTTTTTTESDSGNCH